MNPTRFDQLSRILAQKRSRRTAMRAGGLGLLGGLVGTRTLAQDATPTVDPHDPHPDGDHTGADPEFLFVQPFEGGTWEPKASEEGMYTLTLTGASANTIYFSDRPERITGIAPTQQFLDGLGFTPNNPPNAAIVAARADGPAADGSDHEVLVIELFNPVYDADAETLTYDAAVLADYGEPGLAHLAGQQRDYEIGETFGEGSLFIDDCPTGTAVCRTGDNDKRVGDINIGCCWNASKLSCGPCHSHGSASYYVDKCARNYPDECGAGQCVGKDKVCWF